MTELPQAITEALSQVSDEAREYYHDARSWEKNTTIRVFISASSGMAILQELVDANLVSHVGGLVIDNEEAHWTCDCCSKSFCRGCGKPVSHPQEGQNPVSAQTSQNRNEHVMQM